METFDHVLNWKLKTGSHRFPGPDGGTCINEAALVAAGFEYQPIIDVRQMPKCFSRPICHLAMVLNDQAHDIERQRLLPYVARLACADTPEVEQQRANYIYEHTRSWYFSASLDEGLQALEGALAIGRQADPLGPDVIQSRMDAVKSKAAERPAPPPKRSLAAKVKSWLMMKEAEPIA